MSNDLFAVDMFDRPPLIRLYEGEIFVDEFAGGGGTSEGVEMAIGRPPDVALNHNAEALARLVGNSVPPHLAAALVGANLQEPAA